MDAVSHPSYTSEYIARGLMLKEISGHFRPIKWPRIHGKGAAMLFVPKPSLDTAQKCGPVVLVFFDRPDRLTKMDETCQRLQDYPDCSCFAPKYHGVVECLLDDDDSGEVWKQAALAFDKPSGRPLSQWFDNRNNHRLHATFVQAISEMCSTLTKQHFAIRHPDFNHVHYDDQTGRCMVWGLDLFKACNKKQPCMCEVENNIAYHKLATSCFLHNYDLVYGEHICRTDCRAHGD